VAMVVGLAVGGVVGLVCAWSDAFDRKRRS
jgi:uncharacterized protein involved in exopolysaccharide biosynthesis